jgi:hypothetical protein
VHNIRNSLSLLTNSHSDYPVRDTKQGRLRGFYVNVDNIESEVYLGVAYAQPPIGLLRFEVRLYIITTINFLIFKIKM